MQSHVTLVPGDIPDAALGSHDSAGHALSNSNSIDPPLVNSDSNQTNITQVFSPMTNSLVGPDEIIAERGQEERDDGLMGVAQDADHFHIQAMTGSGNLRGGDFAGQLYIVSDNVEERLKAEALVQQHAIEEDPNGLDRGRQYLVQRSVCSDNAFSSPSSPNTLQGLIHHKDIEASRPTIEKRVNWQGSLPTGHQPWANTLPPTQPPSATQKTRRELPPEPSCFPFFRWFLIMIGLAMLVSVLLMMGQLLVDWANGRAGSYVSRYATTTAKTIAETIAVENEEELLFTGVTETLG